MDNKFGVFDLNRILTDYEVDHFDEFMKIRDTGNEINHEYVDISKAVDDALKMIEEEFK